MLEKSGERRGLDAFLAPRGIAVFGGSSDPATIGGRTLAYLRKFDGPVIAVDGDGAETVRDSGQSVDLAIINLPPHKVEQAVEDCIASGISAIVLYSGGFADLNAAGAAAQERLAARCARAGVRLLGPNSAGVVTVRNGVYATYSHSIAYASPRPGPIAIVTQSGAVGTFALARGVERGLGFSRFIATGNEADIDIAECIEYLADDAETGVILVYLEAAKDGRSFLRAIAAARARGKSVVVLKGGSSETGAAAAASHTGKLAGADRVYDAALRAAGACRVHSIEEMLDVAQACAVAPIPAGNRLAVITGSGGIGVMMADEAAQYGLVLPPLEPAVVDAVRALIPLAGVLNPIDTTGHILNDFGLLPKVVDAVVGGQAMDIFAIFLATVGLDDAMSRPLVAALRRLRHTRPEKLVAVCMMATDAVRRELEELGVVVFDEPSRLVRLLGAMTRLRTPRSELLSNNEKTPTPHALDIVSWDEAGFRAALERAGLPFPPFLVARSATEAGAIARTLGQRVALKVVSPDLAHKSEYGGVALGVAPEDATAAYEAILARVAAKAPQARIEGVGISPMLTDGVEMAIGVQRDPDFGPVILLGLGGIFVESLNDVALRVLPIDRATALEMIDSLRASAILKGVRGKPPVDREALADALLRISDFALAHEDAVESVEINPFLVRETGGFALDALIVPRRPKGSEYGHP